MYPSVHCARSRFVYIFPFGSALIKSIEPLPSRCFISANKRDLTVAGGWGGGFVRLRRNEPVQLGSVGTRRSRGTMFRPHEEEKAIVEMLIPLFVEREPLLFGPCKETRMAVVARLRTTFDLFFIPVHYAMFALEIVLNFSTSVLVQLNFCIVQWRAEGSA